MAKTSLAIKKANASNHQFCSVFTADNGNLPQIPNQTTEKISWVTITPVIVLNTLKQLKPKFSCGPDRIPNFFLKKVAFELSEPLSTLFNISLSTFVPQIWKNAIIQPIYKQKGLINDPVNYRPISLTSTMSKCLETIIRQELFCFLFRNNIITDAQHGFRPTKSTVSQLLECLNSWTTSVDNGKSVDIIYLDFAKAFDSVSHNKLIHKLSSMGISGELLNWIKLFLENRFQQVRVGDCCT